MRSDARASSSDLDATGDLTAAAVWRRMVRGSAWVFGLRVAEQGLGVGRIVVLARLLSPDDFGLIAVALMAMALMRRFSQTGFRQALIQKKGNIQDYLATAWTVNLLRDLALAGIMVATAPLVASFFDAPDARPILQVLALSWVLSGLRNVGLVYLQKDLEYNRYFLYHFSVTVAEMAVSIAAAVVLQSVWALVFGALASNLVGLVLSYVVAPWPRRIGLNWRQTLELFEFGRWILAQQVIAFLASNLDKIVVGRLAGVATLGLYQVAFRVSTFVSGQLVGQLLRPTFPAYARLREQGEAVREAYLKVMQATALISFPVAAITILLADGLTQHVLGEQWLPMVGALQVLAFAGAIGAPSHVTRLLFMGLGRPDLPAKLGAAGLVLLAALIYPLTRGWGIEGAAVAIAITASVKLPVVLLLARRIVGATIGSTLAALAPALAGCLALVSVVALVREMAFGPDSLLEFVALGLAGGVSYLAALGLWAVLFRWSPKKLLTLKAVEDVPST